MIESRILTLAILFGAIFGSGFWLSRAGRPHNGLILTVHKLISLAAVALLYFTVSQVSRASAGIPGLVAAAIAAGVFFAGTIATGGVVSGLKTPPPLVSISHKVLPYLTLLATGVVLYLLLVASRQTVI